MRFWQDITHTVKLTFPIVLGQSIPLLMHLVDVMMIGRLGAAELAANGFATHVVSFFLVCGMGLCNAVQVEVSQAHGRGDDAACLSGLIHGLVVSIAYGAFWTVMVFVIFDWSYWLGQPEAVVTASREYAILLTLSAVPVYAFQCLKNYYEARQSPWTPLWLRVIGLGLNIVLNGLLIFGHAGFPAMGIAGAGIATLIVRSLLLIALMGLMVRTPWFATTSWHKVNGLRLSWAGIWRTLRIGVPSAIHAFLSMGMYSIAGLMFGWLGSDMIAASNIVMRYTNFALMIPLGTSYAATVLVGNAVGTHDFARARRLAWICITGCTAVMGGLAVVTYFGRDIIPLGFTDDAKLVALCSTYFALAAWILLLDGIQFSALGALRGCGDVNVPACVGFIGYWGIALVVAYGFAFSMNMGAQGIWLGLLLGLTVTACILLIRLVTLRISQSTVLPSVSSATKAHRTTHTKHS